MNIEYIKWIDAFGVSASWQEVGEITTEPVLCVSVGFVKETDDYIIVMPHYIKETKHNDESTCGEMAIPKVSIKERIILKEVWNEKV